MTHPPPRKTADQLRSARWFAADDFRSFGHRSRVLQMGYAAEDFIGKPVSLQSEPSYSPEQYDIVLM